MLETITGIQILRFVAAYLVVLMHATQAIALRLGNDPEAYWKTGSVGVDIFFVISGFIMESLVSGQVGPGRRQRFTAALNFLGRRIVRIVPMYWLATLAKVALVLALPGLALRTSLDLQHLLASLVFLPSPAPWGLVEPVLPVGWTLDFEMLFYLAFTFCIAFGVSRLATLLVIFAALLGVARFWPHSPALAFFGRSILFEFALGMAIAIAYRRFPTRHPLWGLACIVAGSALIAGGLHDAIADRFLSWGLCAALIVFGTLHVEPHLKGSRTARHLARCGDSSYSTYLFHTFVVPATAIALGAAGITDGNLALAAIAIAVFLVCETFHHVVEKPVIRLFKRRGPRPGPTPTLVSSPTP